MSFSIASGGTFVWWTTRGAQAWAIADLDIDALERHRAQAQVAVDLDWDGQKAPAFRQARHS